MGLNRADGMVVDLDGKRLRTDMVSDTFQVQSAHDSTPGQSMLMTWADAPRDRLAAGLNASSHKSVVITPEGDDPRLPHSSVLSAIGPPEARGHRLNAVLRAHGGSVHVGAGGHGQRSALPTGGGRSLRECFAAHCYNPDIVPSESRRCLARPDPLSLVPYTSGPYDRCICVLPVKLNVPCRSVLGATNALQARSRCICFGQPSPSKTGCHLTTSTPVKEKYYVRYCRYCRLHPRQPVDL